MAANLLPLFLLLLVVHEMHCSQHGDVKDGNSHVHFVVVGATGSLAQKYLWQGMYDLREEIAAGRARNHDHRGLPSLFLYGAARAEPSKGTKALEEILDTRVSYADAKAKEEFGASVRFVQLKTCDHYETLCNQVIDVMPAADRGGRHCHADGHCESSGDNDTPRMFADLQSTEAGRIFYLAVPPYSYAEVAKCIHRVCRPSNPHAFLRLVLEKPFGTNVDTVHSLVTSLKEDFKDDEIYLVDHYLGKPAVQQILEFRHLNREWLEPLLNGHHIEKVEIAIKEKEDVEGRLNYFDTYGVFLDVLQNHAVEMLCLLAMNLPSGQSVDDTEAIRREKLRFLRSVLPIHPDHVVAGQYSDYVAHGKLEFGDSDFDSRTPTFGAIVLQVPNSRWRGVPFFLASGKALDAKVSLVRITFKNTTFLIADGQLPASSTRGGEITIYVSSSGKSGPWMSVSKEISGGHPIVTTWPKMASPDTRHHAFQFEGRDRAYSTVVAGVFFGRRENFVDMEQLTASWTIWDHYLKVSKDIRPKLYRKGFPEDLEVTWTTSGLRFVVTSEHDATDGLEELKVWPNLHLCNAADGATSLVVKPISKLVKDIVRDLMEIAEADDDEDFHLAVPGGNTPSPIFHELLSSQARLFPWYKSHVWFTDERCVPPSHSSSNFFNAEELLLKHLQLSHLNVHPMPVDLKSGLCSPDDAGSTLYDDQLRRHLGENRSLDVVILGVGSDGHVGSLFPDDDIESTSDCPAVADDRWVTLTKAGRGHVVERRMSLTFKTISRAKTVFLVITGKGKHDVVRQLLTDDDSLRIPSSRFPIKNVAAANSLRVYIDNDAYYG